MIVKVYMCTGCYLKRYTFIQLPPMGSTEALSDCTHLPDTHHYNRGKWCSLYLYITFMFR